MRRLDHSMIFLLIAGTYTPVCLLALHGWLGVSLLVAVWVGALIGIALKVVGLERYRKISAPLYLALGWLAVIAAPQFLHHLALVPLAVAGGLLYTVGAVLFALQWPGRTAAWFGYHEWWHAFVVVAGACFFAMNAYLIATA
jgi:hemolysin III